MTVIAGATGGIGEAVADVFRDHRLVLLGRDSTRLQALRRSYPKAIVRAVDMIDAASVSSVLEDLPQINNLIHCTGAISVARLVDADVDDWQRMMEANLFGPMVLTSAAIPLLASCEGRVVFVSSGAAKRVRPGWSGYAASKFAARALAEGLQAEESNISVLSVFAGAVDTPMRGALGEERGRDYDSGDYLTPSEVADCIAFALGMRKQVSMSEIAIRIREA